MKIEKCPFHKQRDTETGSNQIIDHHTEEIAHKAKLHITNNKRNELLTQVSNIFMQKLASIDFKQILFDINYGTIDLVEYPDFSDLIFTLVMRKIYQEAGSFKDISQDLEYFFPEINGKVLGIPIERTFLSLLMQALLDVIILQLVSKKYALDDKKITSIIAKNMRYGSSADNNNIYNIIEDTLIVEGELARDMTEIPEYIRIAELKKQMLQNIESLNHNTSKQVSCPFFLVDGQKKWMQDFSEIIYNNFTAHLLEDKNILDYYFGKDIIR